MYIHIHDISFKILLHLTYFVQEYFFKKIILNTKFVKTVIKFTFRINLKFKIHEIFKMYEKLANRDTKDVSLILFHSELIFDKI